uniref:Fascin domain-containing protein n=1 Tax=Panagrolaimus davidi TaxID=227884 RepID=A0A914QFL3_9BILA
MSRLSRNVGNKETCFDTNNEFREIRLFICGKVKELQNFINLVDEYKIKNPQSDLSELKLPHDIDNLKKFLSGYTQYDQKLKYAVIRAMHGRFISSQNGLGPMTAGDRPVPLGWEIFAFEERKNSNKIAIKSCGKYISSGNASGDTRCDQESVGDSELFDLIEHGNGVYSFKGSNGKYISSLAERATITCDSDEVNENEKFYIQWLNDLSDEINVSWAYYNEYFTKLCAEYDAGVEEKKKINPENYFFIDRIEVYHNDSENPHSSYHQQRIFNQKGFKELMQKADTKIYKVKYKLENERNFLSGISWGEKRNLERITRKLDSLAPAFARLTGNPVAEIEMPRDNGSS